MSHMDLGRVKIPRLFWKVEIFASRLQKMMSAMPFAHVPRECAG
jgi:hypothetical protein